MSVFRKVNTSFWQDPFVLDLTPEEKYFYLYLMTNTKTSQCGIYEISRKIIEMETGYNRETIDKLLKRFIDYGKILYSDKTKELMLVNWIKYNGSSSPKVLSKIETELKAIKNKAYIQKYIDMSGEHGYCIDTLSILYPYSMDTQSQKEEEEEEEKEEEEEEEKEEEIDAPLELAPAKPKKVKPKKSKYGEYDNVLLTDDEFQKLMEQIPNASTMLERLSEYMASTGKKYASHYVTIRAWSRKDQGNTVQGKKDNSVLEEFMKEMEGRDGNTSLF